VSSQARLDTPRPLHHVMIRGIEGPDIFGDDKDREHFLLRLTEIDKVTGTQILAWTFVDDHVHMVLINQQPIGTPQVVDNCANCEDSPLRVTGFLSLVVKIGCNYVF